LTSGSVLGILTTGSASATDVRSRREAKADDPRLAAREEIVGLDTAEANARRAEETAVRER
jgi:hypothetical protein